jgi:cell division septum initiation protein DivIVA
MGDDQETITVAELSDGPPTGEQPEQSVELPVVEILTGRGFITGKSGSGKSNTASVLAEKLLDNNFGLLIVDIDGEYYGLKEEYEILHVGADEECDIQVGVDHAEKIATLALEKNVPIILDMSSFLDEDEAHDLLTEVSKQLFAKEKKLKQPFLMLVEECHEYIPEKGSVGECGKMLIKIGKRGRKHGLGIVGISQRPADVKKDFITQCDWLTWHRLTWNNDTKVVSRILSSDYADAVEDLDDGEAFLMTDWSESVRRVQFQRKQTFDAGATPGLEDVDRPDLKSVSDDLVSELEEISEEKQQTEDRIAELREELDRKNSRIAELEAELQDARDMSRMADQFVDALVENVKGTNPGRTEQSRLREQRQRQESGGHIDPGPADAEATSQNPAPSTDDVGEDAADESEDTIDMDALADAAAMADGEEPADAESDDDSTVGDDADSDGGDDGARADETSGDQSEIVDTSSVEQTNNGHVPGVAAGSNGESPDEAARNNGHTGNGETATSGSTASVFDADGLDDVGTDPESEDSDDEEVAAAVAEVSDPSPASTGPGPDEPEVVRQLCQAIESMQPQTRRMLRYYHREGPAKPQDAFFSAGGEGDRTKAYAHNRTLRTQGFIEHVGRGHYDVRIEDLVEEEAIGKVSRTELAAHVSAVRNAFTK